MAAPPKKRRRKTQKKKRGSQTEKGPRTLIVAGARHIVILGVTHRDPDKRLDPNIVDLTLVAAAICVVVPD